MLKLPGLNSVLANNLVALSKSMIKLARNYHTIVLNIYKGKSCIIMYFILTET